MQKLQQNLDLVYQKKKTPIQKRRVRETISYAQCNKNSSRASPTHPTGVPHQDSPGSDPKSRTKQSSAFSPPNSKQYGRPPSQNLQDHTIQTPFGAIHCPERLPHKHRTYHRPLMSRWGSRDLHTTTHLFTCMVHPTELAVWDLCDRPVLAVRFLSFIPPFSSPPPLLPSQPELPPRRRDLPSRRRTPLNPAKKGMNWSGFRVKSTATPIPYSKKEAKT